MNDPSVKFRVWIIFGTIALVHFGTAWIVELRTKRRVYEAMLKFQSYDRHTQ